MDVFIYENDLTKEKVSHLTPDRKTVRAIVRRGEEYALAYFNKYQLHGFIGGGIELGEDEKTALTREVLEESGFKVDVKRRVCSINSYAARNSKIEYWHSTYYLCDLVSSGHPLNLEDYEKEFGLEIKWYKRDEVLNIFENTQSSHPFGASLYQRSITAFKKLLELGD